MKCKRSAIIETNTDLEYITLVRVCKCVGLEIEKIIDDDEVRKCVVYFDGTFADDNETE